MPLQTNTVKQFKMKAEKIIQIRIEVLNNFIKDEINKELKTKWENQVKVLESVLEDVKQLND